MGVPRPAALVGGVLVATATAHAVVPSSSGGLRPAAEHLTAMPDAGVTKPLRGHADLRWTTPPSAAWSAFTTVAGGRWRAAYDRATGVPSRIWGTGIPAAGANGSPAIAERVAREQLAAHLALLAPGAAVTDFAIAANHSDGSIRSVSFVQRHGGRRVVGGQVSFRFKNDRLVVLASEALPAVHVTTPRARLSRSVVGARAATRLRASLALPGATVGEAGEEVVLPLVGDDAVLGYRVARPLTIDGGAEGRYLGYADVATGAVLAIRQLNAYATGVVQYRVVDRFPGPPRRDVPAPRAHVTIRGATVTTTMGGGVSWASDAEETLVTSVSGDLVRVVDKATSMGEVAAADLSIAPGGTTVWDASANELHDAQVNVFVATNVVKDYVARFVDPDVMGLGEQMVANVNIGQECNAFFDGKAINFFQKSMKCQNTGLLQDVVYHEFGHALHAAEIVDGVGSFDGAMSEGAADFLAASITEDSGMGRGFFYADTPLREIDPVDFEHKWPDDVKEIHYTGLIFAGAMWDLRKDLIAALGRDEAIRIANKLYVGTLRRATSIPTSLVEALLEDDDDGNLDNGTPHECMIRSAFGRHGLRTTTGEVAAPGSIADRSRSTLVRIDLSGLSTRCSSDDIDKVTIDWRPSGTPEPVAGSTVATAAAAGTYWAQLPTAPDGKVLYRARVEFLDGSTLTLADNLADPYYELYTGDTVPLYCTSFEDGDPFQAGWTTGTSNGKASSWAWGQASGGATDPTGAHSGTHFLAQGLGTEYEPDYGSWVKMPAIDAGRWSDVRLQYRRWLASEDSYFDPARVLVNGRQAWKNNTANLGDASALHHIDREWRFHDVPLSGYVAGTVFEVSWELTADQGLHLGGWHLDDVCIVANIRSICGDGVKSPTEGCDDGDANADSPDRCRSYCMRPTCGDEIVDGNEQCDHGFAGDATCTNQCKAIELPTLGGLCSTGGSSGPASLGLGAAVAALVLRRRKKRGRSPISPRVARA